jgi:hypothetical protein
LLFFVISATIGLSLFNICGVTITKEINALARSVGDSLRTIVVWIVGIALSLTVGRT